MYLRTRAVPFLVAAAAVLSLVPSTGASQAPSPCAVAVTLYPAQLTVQITATEPGAVTFQGNVTIDKPASVRATVNLQASTSEGWATTVSPASMTFAGSILQQPFALTVVVPPGTSASVVGTVTVVATAIAAGLTCPPATASSQILVSPYQSGLRARLDATDVKALGNPPVATFRITMTMQTNIAGAISVTLEVVAPAGATHDAPSVVQLIPAPNGTASGSATIHVRPGGVEPGTYPVIVRAVAANLNETSTVNGTMTVAALPVPGNAIPAAALLAIVAAAARWRRPHE